MTPQDFQTVPHTVDEALGELRVWNRRKAEDIANRCLRVTITPPPDWDPASAEANIQLAYDQLRRFARWEATDELKQIADATPRLSHKSCRKTAVVLPRWRRMRDRNALEPLLAKLAGTVTSDGPVIDLHPDRFGADEHDTEATESPPIADRHEPAELRGPPAPRHMQMHGPWTADYSCRSEVMSKSDTAAVRHTTASAWVLSKGGERT